jgi:hypothetical protein
VSTRALRVLQVGLAALVVVFLLASYLMSRAAVPTTEASAQALDRVVVFAVPGLSLDDVDTGLVPNIDRLADRGAIAIANVRTQPKTPDLVAAYASLGAGNRTYGAELPPEVVPSGLPWLGTTAAEVISERVGRPVTGDLAVPALPDIAAEVAPEGGTNVGALGTALRAGGRRTAFVGQSGAIDPAGPGRVAPGALAVVDDDGMIDVGSVGDHLVTTLVDADGTDRVVSDPDAFAAAVARAQDRADLVFVDSGDTTRARLQGEAEEARDEAVREAEEAAEEEAEAAGITTTSAPDTTTPVEAPSAAERAEDLRVTGLQRTDQTLGRIVDELAPGTLLLVVGVSPPGSTWGFTPLVAVGPGIARGYLDSTSTHRPALVTLTDLAPTILDTLEVDVPGGMIGQPLRFRAAESTWDEARILDDLIADRASVDRTMNILFITAQSVLYGITVLLLLTDRVPKGKVREGLLLAALTCGAWPAATYVLRIWTSLYSMGTITIVLSWAIAFAIGLVASRARAHPLDPVLVVSGLTVAIIVGDLATGAHLQVGSFFGYMPHTAPRFTGLGNSGFAILAGASIMVVTALVARARDHRAAWSVAVAIAVVVVLADGAPWMGTDVGGILALVPVLGLTLWALRGRPIRMRTLVVGALLGAVVLALAVGFEALRDPGDRTHIGRFFLQAGEGGGIGSTLRRKWDTNVEDLTRSPLFWIVPFLVVAGVVVARRSPAIQRLLPVGSPQRIAAVASLAVGTAGWLVNDSGVVVLALACVQLGPLFLALIGSGSAAEPARRPPDPPGGGEPPPGAPRVDDLDPDPATAPPPAPLAPRNAESVTSSEQPRRSDTDADRRDRVVAIVPAKDRADRVADTVAALLAIDRIDTVLVVDDGSADDTATVAAAAGADVLRLPENRGKGAAVLAGAAHTPDADVYLLIDADLARTAAAADLLLGPVLAGDADLTVGVLPSAGGKGGFGTIRTLSAAGIRRACGLEVRAPLSGQRAIRAERLRGLADAERFGLEVAMTIDVVRAGGRVVEVEVPMDHLHTGKSLSGFAHRGRQGLDIARSLWPRLTTPRQRIAITLLITLLAGSLAVVAGTMRGPASEPGGRPATKVVIFAMNPYSFDDLAAHDTPNLQGLMDRGSVGAMSVRTVARTSNDAEGFLAIGSGARLAARGDASRVLGADESVGPMTASAYLASLTGTEPSGDLVAVGAVGLLRANRGPQAAGRPGFLADELADHGLEASFVGTADRPGLFGDPPSMLRPAALAVMRSDGGVRGVVDDLTVDDPTAPYGVRTDPARVADATLRELDDVSLVVVDPGDLDRAAAWARSSLPGRGSEQWAQAIARTDETLGRIIDGVDADTLVIVTSLRPRSGFHLQPVVVAGPNVPVGTLQSGSTKRDGLVALTDVAPTVLNALGIAKPTGVPGNAFRYEQGNVDLDHLERLDRDTVVRERTYYGQSRYFILAHAAVYLLALLVVARRPRWPRLAPWVSWLGLSLASYPMTSFLVRLVPNVSAVFDAQVVLALAGALLFGWWTSTRPGDPLRGISWVAGATTAVIVLDTWLGTPMQMSSWLGSSMHNAGRFYGIPNTTFAVLGACSVLWGALHVERATRRTEAVVRVGCVFLLALISAGLPMLGADVGTLMTLFPVYALLLVVLLGRRIRLRTAIAAGVSMVGLVVLAALADLARPEASRSHLGRFADQVLDEGPSAIFDSFLRKQSANFRILGGSTWTDLLPIVAIFLVVTLVVWRWWGDALPAGTARRHGFLAVLGAALLGFATNDSGPIVIALFVAFLAPFTLLAVRSEARPTEPEPIGPPEVGPETTALDAEVAS